MSDHDVLGATPKPRFPCDVGSLASMDVNPRFSIPKIKMPRPTATVTAAVDLCDTIGVRTGGSGTMILPIALGTRIEKGDPLVISADGLVTRGLPYDAIGWAIEGTHG